MTKYTPQTSYVGLWRVSLTVFVNNQINLLEEPIKNGIYHFMIENGFLAFR